MPAILHRMTKDILKINGYQGWRPATPGSPWYVVPNNNSWGLRPDFFQILVVEDPFLGKMNPARWLVCMKDGTFRLGWGDHAHPNLAPPITQTLDQEAAQALLNTLKTYLEKGVWALGTYSAFGNYRNELIGTHITNRDSNLHYYRREERAFGIRATPRELRGQSIHPDARRMDLNSEEFLKDFCECFQNTLNQARRRTAKSLEL